MFKDINLVLLTYITIASTKSSAQLAGLIEKKSFKIQRVRLVQWIRSLTLNYTDGVQFPAKATVFSVSLCKGLSLCFMCSDQHVNYWMSRGFPLTSSFVMDLITTLNNSHKTQSFKVRVFTSLL